MNDDPVQTSKHILILCFSHLAKDARVLRQVDALRNVAIVSCGAFSPSGLENGQFVKLGNENTYLDLPTVQRKMVTAVGLLKQWLFRISGNYRAAYWKPALRRCFHQLRHLAPDLIIANDLDTLPLALKLAGTDTKVIFDAHEFYPQQHAVNTEQERKAQRASIYWCRTLMPKVDRCITVSDAVANAFEELIGIRPVVLTNAPAFSDLRPMPVNGKKIRLVHHGAVSRQRRTEDLLLLMDELKDDHELHLFLMTDAAPQAYVEQLQVMAAQRPNIIVHQAIPPAEIPRMINHFDIGIHRLPPVSQNHAFALPNKVFEFVQARLAIVVGPNPAMASLVSRNELGLVANGFDNKEMADAIRSLSRERIMRFKMNANSRARTLSSECNMELLLKMVRELL